MARRRKNQSFLEGKTEDGRLVLNGIFKLMDTHGMPLMIIVDRLKENNMLVAWDIFYEDAEKAGWKKETIELRMLEAIGDCYDPEYKEGFKEALENWKKYRFNCTSPDTSQSSEKVPKPEPSKE